MILLYSLEWLQLKKWVIIPWMIDRISYRFTNITISITVKSLNGTISVLHADYVEGRGFGPRSDRIIQDISDLPRVLTHIQEANGCVVYGEALRSGKGYQRAEDGYEYKTKPRSSQRKDSLQGRPIHPHAQRGFDEILGNPTELSAIRTNLDTIEDLS